MIHTRHLITLPFSLTIKDLVAVPADAPLELLLSILIARRCPRADEKLINGAWEIAEAAPTTRREEFEMLSSNQYPRISAHIHTNHPLTYLDGNDKKSSICFQPILNFSPSSCEFPAQVDYYIIWLSLYIYVYSRTLCDRVCCRSWLDFIRSQSGFADHNRGLLRNLHINIYRKDSSYVN